MTLTLPTLSPVLERAVERGWSRDGLAWFLRDKARTLGGMADHRTGWFRYWRWEDADEGLRGEILNRLDKGEWDHLKDVCNAPGVPGHGTDPESKGNAMPMEDIYGTGKYLKATSEGVLGLPGKPETLVLTIASYEIGTFPDGKKQLVCTFKEPDAEGNPIPVFGLNVTNYRTIARFTGTQHDNGAWVGVRIELFVIPENEKSKSGYAVRVKKPSAVAAPAPSPSANIPMGDAAEKVLAQKIKDCAEEVGDGCNLDALRTFLAQCFPDAEAVIAGAPATWPRRVGPEITNWLKSQASPFG